MLNINLFGSYNLHLMMMTKLSSWKKTIVASTGRNRCFAIYFLLFCNKNC